ncbi:MAG: hypothetical protein ACJ73S_03455 [Mycobacteriales bacterium]
MAVKVARKVARWHRLQHTLALPPNRHSHDAETVRQRRHANWARRLTLGLPTTATDAEVAAFTAPNLDTARAVAATCMDIHDRLRAAEAGEKASEKPTASPVSPPASRRSTAANRPGGCPTGTPQERRVDQLQPGDIIAGCWGPTALGGGDRRLVTGFARLVQHVSAVVDRHEGGRWIQIRLANGSEHHYQTHVWVVVHPGAARHLVELATAGPTKAPDEPPDPGSVSSGSAACPRPRAPPDPASGAEPSTSSSVSTHCSTDGEQARKSLGRPEATLRHGLPLLG